MITSISQTQYSIKLFRRNYVLSVHAALVFVIIAAILLRLLSALLQGNAVTILPGIHDQVSYDSLARRVVSGFGFSFAENHWPMTGAGEPTAHWSFSYTLYLAGLYSLFGHQPLLARLLQAVIVGCLHIYLIYCIGERAFSKTVGLVSAAITAFYIYFVYYGGALMTEPFYITAILYSLLAAIQVSENSDTKKDITLGVNLGIALGLTVLFRQVFLLFLPFLLVWSWMARFRRYRHFPLVSTGLALIVLALLILPVTLYNQSRFGQLVPLNTNSGYAFFWGNHPIYGTRFIPILPTRTYQELIPPEVRHLDEAALDQALLQRGLQFVFDDPKRYVLLSLSRVPAYFMFWPSSNSGLISNISRVASFGVLLPFIIYGLILAVRKNRAEQGTRFFSLLSSPAGLLIIFAFIYTVVHLLTWALIRYRLPVDAVLIPFASLAIRSFNLSAVRRQR